MDLHYGVWIKTLMSPAQISFCRPRMDTWPSSVASCHKALQNAASDHHETRSLQNQKEPKIKSPQQETVYTLHLSISYSAIVTFRCVRSWAPGAQDPAELDIESSSLQPRSLCARRFRPITTWLAGTCSPRSWQRLQRSDFGAFCVSSGDENFRLHVHVESGSL